MKGCNMQNGNKMKRIALINNKGGVSKTTLATNIAASLSKKNNKVLLIDLDQQCNIADIWNIKDNTKNIWSLIDSDQSLKTINETIVNVWKSNKGNGKLDLILGSTNISNLDRSIANGELSLTTLNDLLKKIEKNYDFIIFDTSPTMSYIHSSIILASTDLIIPMKPEQLSLKGSLITHDIIAKANEFIKSKGYDMKPKIIGCLFTQVRKKLKSHQDIMNNFKTMNKCFETYMSMNSYYEIYPRKYQQPLVLKTDGKPSCEINNITSEIELYFGGKTNA